MERPNLLKLLLGQLDDRRAPLDIATPGRQALAEQEPSAPALPSSAEAPGKRTLVETLGEADLADGAPASPLLSATPSADVAGHRTVDALAGQDGGGDDPVADVMGRDGTLRAESTSAHGPLLAQAPTTPAPQTGAQSAGSAPGPAPAPPPKVPWEKVDKSTARKDLELEWIEKLPQHLKDGIDVEFATGGREEKRVAQRIARDPAMKKLVRERDKALEKLRGELAKAKVKVPRKDPRYIEAAAQWKVKVDEKFEELAAVERKKATRTTPKQSAVDKPITKNVAIDAGQTAARKNFQEWNRGVFRGNLGAAKKHFQSIEEVDKGKGMWLAKSAAERYRLARQKFEADHRGFTLPTTTVAQAMRGLHQDRKGIGMLGHALGVSIDLRAHGSPNIQGAKGEPFGSTKYMLEKFGGDPTTGARGRAQMDLGANGSARIKRLGQHTVANTVDSADEQTAHDVRTQFIEMSETSKRFQKSLPEASLKLLQATRADYFQLMQDQKRLAALQKNPSPDTAEERANLMRSVSDLNARVNDALARAFSPWTQTLEAENATDRFTASFEEDNQGFISQHKEKLASLADAALDAFAEEHMLPPRSEFRPSKRVRTYKAALAAALAQREKDSQKALANASGAVAVRESVLARLRDPRRVFGDVAQSSDGGVATKSTVKDPSVMQLLERGFVHDDGIQQAPGSGKKEILNADTVETLARYGFAPGATFLDTHHYDFIEGYDVVPGGRSRENLDADAFSPEGEKPPPAPKKKASPSRKP